MVGLKGLAFLCIPFIIYFQFRVVKEGVSYYHHASTNTLSLEHPLDSIYRDRLKKAREELQRKRLLNSSSQNTLESRSQSPSNNTNDVTPIVPLTESLSTDSYTPVRSSTPRNNNNNNINDNSNSENENTESEDVEEEEEEQEEEEGEDEEEEEGEEGEEEEEFSSSSYVDTDPE